MLSLKNQFIFAPIKTGYSNGSGLVTEKHLAFYKRRAQYLDAVTPVPFYLDKGLRELPTQMGIDDDNKIEGRTVYAERNGESITFDDIDIIVVSTSMKSYNPLENELKKEISVCVIGDAKKVGNAQDAIREGY